MSGEVKFRCTQDDSIQIRAAARKMGLNNSAYIRLVLIQSGVITP